MNIERELNWFFPRSLLFFYEISVKIGQYHKSIGKNCGCIFRRFLGYHLLWSQSCFSNIVGRFRCSFSNFHWLYWPISNCKCVAKLKINAIWYTNLLGSCWTDFDVIFNNFRSFEDFDNCLTPLLQTCPSFHVKLHSHWRNLYDTIRCACSGDHGKNIFPH